MELDPVAVALKFGFLAVLYLFLFWMARSALKDLRRGSREIAPAYEDATGLHHATAGLNEPLHSTAASANEASTCVTGLISEPEACCLMLRLRISRELASKRRCSCAAAPCRRTMRQASTFSSTT